MSTKGGRDQVGPMERIVALTAKLHHAGATGVKRAELLRIGGWKDDADGISALGREFRHLKAFGWRIENIAPSGLPGVYRMTNVDNRFTLRLSAAQQTALRRAVLLVDRDDLADQLGLVGAERPPAVGAVINAREDGRLTQVVTALREKAVLRFRYNGSERVVHPESVRTQQTHWYLFGHEDGSDVVKAFVVSRMSDVRADAPRTASHLEHARRSRLHPMSWEVDPPVDVTLRTTSTYAADVRRWLGEPADERERDGIVELIYRVTHRAALRARLYQLGMRVSVVGPDDIRKELLTELATMAGE
jgi:predicted DNA-binding transcriptional regulator YafY